jgi:NitT/TauT family transport system permease protein
MQDKAPTPLLERLTRSKVSVVSIQLGILAIFLVAWELLVRNGTLPRFWFSSPSAILATISGWVRDGSLWRNLSATLQAMSIGYVIGCVSGVAAGFILGLLPFVRKLLAPILAALYALPKISLAPLFVIVFGIGLESKIALVSINVFFLLLYSTLDGVSDMDNDLVEAVRQMGATNIEIIRKLYIPATLLWVYSGMRLAVRYALSAAVLGEVIASNRGIGYLIEFNAGQFIATGVFAAVILLMTFSIGLMKILMCLESANKKRSGQGR